MVDADYGQQLWWKLIYKAIKHLMPRHFQEVEIDLVDLLEALPTSYAAQVRLIQAFQTSSSIDDVAHCIEHLLALRDAISERREG